MARPQHHRDDPPPYVEQFRVEVFGKPRAPWRDSVDEAMRDAIRQDLASWDEEQREHFLAVPVAIAMRKVSTPR